MNKNYVFLKISIVSILFLGLNFSKLDAQTNLLGWEINGITNYGSSPLSPTLANSNISFVGLTRGAGIGTSGTAASNAWGGNDFNLTSPSEASAITAGDTIIFRISSVSGYLLSLNSIKPYNIRRSNSGPTTGQWQYRIGNGAYVDLGADITWGGNSAGGNLQPAITLSSISALQNLPSTSTVTFRLIVWGATGNSGVTSGTLYFNQFQTGEDLVIDGTVCAVPSSLTYSSSTMTTCINTPITTNTVSSISGTSPFTYTISPTLPSGLNIDTNTGAISGTPFVASPLTNYTVTATNSCGNTTAMISITVPDQPTTANAGPDQTGIATCGQTSVTLAANTPMVGSGSWSIVSGAGGTVTTPSSPTSTFTGVAGTTYTLRWTISNAPCTASTDDVVITFNQNPTAANAGPDQTGIATCGQTSVTLAANTPTIGTGSWMIVSGAGGTVTTPSSPTSTFTGVAGTTYTLRWTISNAPCTASTDDVVITFNQNPTAANAGPDQTGIATCGQTSVTLAANTPTIGTGSWMIVSGAGGTVTTPSSPTSTFTGVTGTSYTLRWTISNAPCAASTDDVIITLNQNPTAGISGGNTICANQTTTLTATGGVSYVWSTGGMSNMVSVGIGSYTVTVTASNSCTDTESFTVNQNNTNNNGTSGIYESYFVLNTTGSNVFYDLHNATANPDFNGANLGSFVSGGSAFIKGGEIKTYKNNPANICGGRVYYNVYPAAGSPGMFTSINLPFMANLGGPNQQWGTTASNINFLNTLSPGSYKLAVYVDASGDGLNPTTCGCDPLHVQNNSGAYFVANFTVTGCAPVEAGTISGDNTLCIGDVTTLTSDGDAGGVWSSSDITVATIDNNGLVTALMDGTATIKYKVFGAMSCPSDSALFTVTVNPLPIVEITISEMSGTANDDGFICAGASVTLTASGGNSYNWDNGISNGIAFNPMTTTTYVVTVTDINMCSSTESETINVNALPVASIAIAETSGNMNNDGTICSGASVTLTANGGTSYSWNNMITNGISFVPPGNLTYVVTVTDANGCTDTESTSITVNSLPMASIAIAETSGNMNNDGSVCSGAAVTLTASGGTSYNWNNMVTNGMAFIPAGSNTYAVTVTDANGCTDTESTTITVNSLPTASIAITETSGTINNDGAICSGASVTLTASGGATYNWNNMILNGNSFVPPGSLTYVVTVTDANGCTDTESASITVNSLPTASIAIAETSGMMNNDGTVCSGAAVTLTASGGSSYSWSNMVSNGMAFIPSGTNTYTVTVTDANGCTDTESTTITVNGLPTASIAIAETSGIMNNDGVICNGAAVTLTASGGTSYNWTNMVVNGMAFTPSNTSNYTVTVTDVNGCTDTESTTVTVNTLPTAAITLTNSPTCEASTAKFTIEGTADAEISYNINGGTTLLDTLDNSGATLVEISPVTANVTLNLLNVRNILTNCSLALSDTETVIVNDTSNTTVNLTECNSYTWSANGQTYLNGGTYMATLTNAVGCDSVVTLNLTINNSQYDTTYVTACTPYTWNLTGLTYSMGGTYIFDSTNVMTNCQDTAVLVLAFGTSSINNPNDPNCYTTVADALDNAVSGDTVFINAGTYFESFEVGEGVTLVINGGSSVSNAGVICNNGFIIINGGSFTNSAVYRGSGVFVGNFVNGSGGKVKPGGCSN